jgi:hypothetical protein
MFTLAFQLTHTVARVSPGLVLIGVAYLHFRDYSTAGTVAGDTPRIPYCPAYLKALREAS